jgi:hypothetical protein
MFILFIINYLKETFNLPVSSTGDPWQWINCDKDFIGYYEAEYTDANIAAIGEALENGNIVS